jgi:hypothetical protein
MAQTFAVARGTLPDAVPNTVDLEVSGFGAPDAAIIFGGSATSDGNGATGVLGIGFWANEDESQTSAGFWLRDGQGTVASYRVQIASRALQYPTLSGSVQGSAWTASEAPGGNGIRLTMANDSTTSARLGTALLLKGVSAKVGTLSAATTQNSTASVSGLSFTPKLVFFISVDSTAETLLADDTRYSFGFAEVNGVQRSIGFYEEDNVTTTQLAQKFSEDRCLTIVRDDALTCAYEVTTWASDGFTVTTRDGTGNANTLHYIAIGGADLSYDCGTLTTETSGTPTTSYATDVATDALMLFMGTVANTTLATDATATGLSIGAATSSAQYAVGAFAEDNRSGTESGNISSSTNVLEVWTVSGASNSNLVAGSVAFDSDSFNITYSQTNATARKGFWVAFGDAAAGGTTVNPGVGALAVTGLVPTVTTQRDVSAGLGALTITGHAPTVSTTSETAVSAGLGALTITGLAPTVTEQEAVSADAGALVITGHAPTVTVTAQGQVAVSTAALTITGHAPTVTQQIVVSPEVSALAITGYAPTTQVVSDTSVTTGLGALTIAGYAPTVDLLLNVLPDVGQIVITGHAPSVSGGTASVVARQEGGGAPSRKPSKRRRKPVLVEIDGQQFVVNSEAEAVELAEKASEAAKEVAERQAAEIVAKREKKGRKAAINTSPLRLDEPLIEVKPLNDGSIDQKWLAEVSERMDSIKEAYRSVAERYETAMLLRVKEELDEEDTLVALFLTF